MNEREKKNYLCCRENPSYPRADDKEEFCCNSDTIVFFFYFA
jgi:hypothetical protein